MDKRGIKKRKFVNQITNSILDTPPLISKKIKALSGNLVMECPSRDGCASHKVIISAFDEKIKFECDCVGGYSEVKSGFCIHIRGIIINMCNDYINNACDFTEKKENYVKLKHDMDDIILNLKKIII